MAVKHNEQILSEVHSPVRATYTNKSALCAAGSFSGTDVHIFVVNSATESVFRLKDTSNSTFEYAGGPVAPHMSFEEVYDNGTVTSTATIDLFNGNKQKITLSGATVTLAFTGTVGPTNGQLFVHNKNGNSTIEYSGTVYNTAAYTPSATSAATDVLSILWDGTTNNAAYLQAVGSFTTQ